LTNVEKERLCFSLVFSFFSPAYFTLVMTLFLGFDLSTQSLKATVLDGRTLTVVKELSVNFDSELPHYGTKGGAIRHPDNLTVTTPTILWVEALDLLLEKFQREKFPLDQVLREH
jgi:xylulokinase